MEKFDLTSIKFVAYCRGGLEVPGLYWFPLSYCERTGCGTYLLKYDRACRTPIHKHGGLEEFLVLKGKLFDEPSGICFVKGNYGRFDKGTHHFTWTGEGCIVFVISGGPNTVMAGL